MGLNNIFVFTHDSIGLGEDGPTHQAIEHINSLRDMPNNTANNFMGIPDLTPQEADLISTWITELAQTGIETTSNKKNLT